MNKAQINIHEELLDIWWDKTLQCAQYDIEAQVVAFRMTNHYELSAAAFLVALFETATPKSDLLKLISRFESDMIKSNYANWKNDEFGGELFWRYMSYSTEQFMRARGAALIPFRKAEWPRIIKDHPGVVMRAASNRKVDPSCLKMLINNPIDDIRYMLASNPNLDMDSVRILSEDPSVAVRALLAKRETLGQPVLAVLLNDKSNLILETLARRKDLTLEASRVILHRNDSIVERELARHSPYIEILDLLTNNDVGEIAQIARERLQEIAIGEIAL